MNILIPVLVTALSFVAGCSVGNSSQERADFELSKSQVVCKPVKSELQQLRYGYQQRRITHKCVFEHVVTMDEKDYQASLKLGQYIK